MALVDRQVARTFPTPGVRDLLSGLARSSDLLSRPAPSADLLTARSLASVGLTGLIGLPFLLLASVFLHAPLAGPAAISLGYLAAAHAMMRGQPRRAAAWTLAVLAGFIAWTLLSLAADQAAPSAAGIAAVLLAPVFAAAPAFARRFVARSPAPAAEDQSRLAALSDAACLDRLAPAEAVLVVDDEGQLLFGTHAGLAELGLQGAAAGANVTRQLHLQDRRAFLDALARCLAGAAESETGLRRAQGAGAAAPLRAVFRANGPRTATLRLEAAPADGRAAAPQAEPNRSRAPVPPPTGAVLPSAGAATCDVQEALAFALRHNGSRARGKGVGLLCTGDSSVIAACDRQVCRRLLHALIEAALKASRPGATIGIRARSARGCVLVSVAFEAEGEAASLGPSIDLGGARELAEAAGGTLVTEQSGGRLSVSLRLARGDAGMRDGADCERSGAA